MPTVTLSYCDGVDYHLLFSWLPYACLAWSSIFKPDARRSRRCRPARTWFLKFDPVRIIGIHVLVCVCVCARALCVSAPKDINN